MNDRKALIDGGFFRGPGSSDAERWVADNAQQNGEEFGDVVDYGIWTGKIDLDPNPDAEGEDSIKESLIAAVWGEYLLVQQDPDGIITVRGYTDVEARDAEWDRLSAIYLEWLEETGSSDSPGESSTVVSGEW